MLKLIRRTILIFVVATYGIQNFVSAATFRFQVSYPDRMGTSTLIQSLIPIELFGSPYSCVAVLKQQSERDRAEKRQRAGVICHPTWVKKWDEGDFSVELACKDDEKKDTDIFVPTKDGATLQSIKLSCK